MKKTAATAMGFYGADGVNDAWMAAEVFAGENGRIATLPDLLDARIAADHNTFHWGRWVTTKSAEYYGLYKNETPLIVVAHGIGPLSTLDGVLTAMKAGESDDSYRGDRCGRISQREFDDLVDGKYGDVHIVDAQALCDARNLSVGDGHCKARPELIQDPLFIARVGGIQRANAYLDKHETVCREAILENGYISAERLQDAEYFCIWNSISDTPYYAYATKGLAISPAISTKDKGFAYANLLVIDQLAWTLMRSAGMDQLYSKIDIHKNGGVRFLATKEGGVIAPDVIEFNYNAAVASGSPSLLVPSDAKQENKLVRIMSFGDKFYTDTAKVGVSIDNAEPEHPVLSVVDVGEPVVIDVGENFSVLRYGIEEHVVPQAPADANAYTRIAFDPLGSWIKVQFHKAEVDVSQKLVTEDEVKANPAMLLGVVEQMAA